MTYLEMILSCDILKWMAENKKEIQEYLKMFEKEKCECDDCGSREICKDAYRNPCKN